MAVCRAFNMPYHASVEHEELGEHRMIRANLEGEGWYVP